MKGEKEIKHRFRQGLTVAVIILFIGISVISSTGRILEKSSTVSFDGNIFYVGGSGEGNYTKIQDAIDNASDGDMVFVYNGTYVECLIVNKSINLIGEDRNITVIDGNMSGDVVIITVDKVTISGFTITRSGNGVWDMAIRVHSVNSTMITDNIITNNRVGIFLGDIYLGDSFGNTVKGNIISFNAVGINCQFSDYSNISDNFFSDNYNGIHFSGGGDHNVISCNHFNLCENLPIQFFGSYNIITGNIINSTGEGNPIPGYGYGEIYSHGDDHSIISNNTLINYEGKYRGGIYLYWPENSIVVGNYISSYYFDGIEIERGTNNTISDNILRDNNDNGIDLFLCRKTTITGNILQGSDCGIILLGCWNNNVSGNAMLNNNYGIGIGSGCFNEIYQNNFINNNKSAEFLRPLGNKWRGNYWDKPRVLPYVIYGHIRNPIFYIIISILIYVKFGYLIPLGLLFEFLSIPWINIDWHPAKEPYDI